MDVTLTVALGGLADIALLRSELALFRPVAFGPTVSRLIDTLAASGEKALTAIRTVVRPDPKSGNGSGGWPTTGLGTPTDR